MDYENIQQIISRVLTETASEEETSTLYAWLEADEENRKLYFQLKDIFDTRKAVFSSDIEKLESSWEILSQKIDERVEKEKSSKHRLFIRYASAAVAGLIILLTTLFFVTNNKPAERWVEIYNAPGSVPKIITLEDGTEIKLNSASNLKYPEKFSNNKREIHLKGEALFTVTRDERKPFIVYSNSQEVTVLGTIFNINSYDSNPYSETTLISGKVKLNIKNKQGEMREEIIMSQNQQLRFNKETLKSELKSVDSQNIISWTNNEYIFKNTQLDEILKRLSTIYDVTFIATSKQKDQKYTCKFSVEQSLSDVLDILNFKDQFNYTIKNDTIIITDKQ